MKKLTLLALVCAMFTALLAPAALAHDGPSSAGAELAQVDYDEGAVADDGGSAATAGALLLGSGLLGLRVLRRDA